MDFEYLSIVSPPIPWMIMPSYAQNLILIVKAAIMVVLSGPGLRIIG